MPQESQLAHRVISNTAIPYITLTSPTSTDPHFTIGSFDILTSIGGFAERRPGFANFVEQTPTTFNNLQRLFTWDRFDGTFIVMACDINAGGFAVVYKMIVGVDASFVSIFTEPTATNTAYDFVVSNNTVYFSNGFYVRKWDPVNGISNWGIAGYVASGSTSAYAGTAAQATWDGGSTAWSNPGHATGAPDGSYATVSITGSGSSNISNYLQLTNYGLSVGASNSVSGITVNVTCHVTGPFFGTSLVAQLMLHGNVIGTQKVLGFTNTTDAVLTFGGPSDVWGTTGLNGVIVSDSSFGVALIASEGSSTTAFVDAAQIVCANSGAPNVTFTGTGLTASVGYQYVICYSNSNTGHVGSPSPPSNKVVPVNQSMSIPVVASTDPQVNQIRIFRTTDSATGLGGQAYFEIQNSPVPNTTASITDSTADANLNATSIAPTPTFNDPPTPIRGMVYYSGRIWGFTGNKVWFTGLEEITIGVPEESMPSGIAGNFWAFDQPVQALAAAGIGANQALVILSGGRIYVIQGNTLDTFVRYTVSKRRGCRNLTCISELGGVVAWLDSAQQVWAFDGTNLNELTTLIRNDLTSVNPATSSVTFHTAGRFHWFVLSTGTRLYVYDVDQDQWMPPWTFAAKYIYSGEISPGNYVLMASNGTKALQLSTSAFNDNGLSYAPIMKLGLLSVVPDYGSRFSYIGVGSYNEPTRTGYPATFQVTNNAQPITDVLICSDEAPAVALYNSIAANLVDTSTAFNRRNGIFMTQKVYQTITPASRWIGIQINLANADQVDQIYEIFMAYKSLGGR